MKVVLRRKDAFSRSKWSVDIMLYGNLLLLFTWPVIRQSVVIVYMASRTAIRCFCLHGQSYGYPLLLLNWQIVQQSVLIVYMASHMAICCYC